MNQKDTGRSRRTILFTASTIIFVLCVGLIYLVINIPSLSTWFSSLGTVFAPVLGGLVLAYLCNPILRFIERHPLRRIKSPRFKRLLSIFLTYLFFVLLIALLGILIIPQLVQSVQELFANFDNYIANAVTYINQLLTSIMGNMPPAEDGSPQMFLSLDKLNALLNTLSNSLGSIIDVLLQNIAAYGSKLVSAITNAILALFISFYLLASKETRAAQVKKMTAALFNEKHNKFIYDTATLANNAFGNFIGAKILDSFIVAIIEYILFSLFGIPYAPMLACILGMTNIIPFFGPIIGAIPSGFIVFISEPTKFIPFLIIMLIVQQTDANIIEPRILGNRTGVSPLCVIIAISVMGNLWGVAGMILGVPLFAVVIALVQQFLNVRLEAKGMATDLESYYAPEAEHDIALAQGKARLSWRYYVDFIRYSFAGQKRGKEITRPNKQDYLIYPVDPLDQWTYSEKPIEQIENDDQTESTEAVSDHTAKDNDSE